MYMCATKLSCNRAFSLIQEYAVRSETGLAFQFEFQPVFDFGRDIHDPPHVGYMYKNALAPMSAGV